jgi:hypothetical protein
MYTDHRLGEPGEDFSLVENGHWILLRFYSMLSIQGGALDLSQLGMGQSTGFWTETFHCQPRNAKSELERGDPGDIYRETPGFPMSLYIP